MAEIAQAVGSRAQMIVANEATWGVVNPTPTFRAVRVVPGESLDINVQTYRSRQIRSDRMHNATVRGTQKPGGVVPGELSYTGWNFWLYHLLGGTPVTTGTGPYTHVIKGASSLPVGFSLEKGFTDVAEYFAFLGCRVNSGSFSFNIDRTVDMQFDIEAQQSSAASGTSINTLGAPSIPTEDPYTSVNIAVYEGSGLTLLGIAQDLRLLVNNHLYGDRGFILGNNLRQNLKPGTREVTCSGTFMFENASLYNEAINGTATKLKIIASDPTSTYSTEFFMPNFRFLPNGTMPKIHDDGPITVVAGGEAIPDSGTGTDIQVTIHTTEAEFIA